MQTVEEVRRQLEVAHDLHEIVGTMKTLAAASIRQAEEAVAALGTYYDTVERGFQILLRRTPDLWLPWTAASVEPDVALVFGAGQGLCGRFNERLAEYVQEHRPEKGPLGTVATVGDRIVPALERRGLSVALQFEAPSAVAGIPDAVRAVLMAVDTWQEEGGTTGVMLYHHKPQSGTAYTPRVQRLMPLDPDWFSHLRAQPWPTNQLPTYTMDEEALLAALIRQYLFVSLFRAFAESMASEHASRLASMQAAERNVEGRIDSLSTRLRQRRQHQITEEVMDVTAGFRALTGVPISTRASKSGRTGS
jgi:F-type H+-transporting ATPase subunit gamma